ATIAADRVVLHEGNRAAARRRDPRADEGGARRRKEGRIVRGNAAGKPYRMLRPDRNDTRIGDLAGAGGAAVADVAVGEHEARAGVSGLLRHHAVETDRAAG